MYTRHLIFQSRHPQQRETSRIKNTKGKVLPLLKRRCKFFIFNYIHEKTWLLWKSLSLLIAHNSVQSHQKPNLN